VTSVVFALRSSGLLGLTRRIVGHAPFGRALAAVRLGSDRFVIQATAFGPTGERVDASVAGRGECRTTGIVTAAATEILLDASAPAGVHHLDEVVAPDSFLTQLESELTLEVDAFARHTGR
jgi:hypothetical protein